MWNPQSQHCHSKPFTHSKGFPGCQIFYYKITSLWQGAANNGACLTQILPKPNPNDSFRLLSEQKINWEVCKIIHKKPSTESVYKTFFKKNASIQHPSRGLWHCFSFSGAGRQKKNISSMTSVKTEKNASWTYNRGHWRFFDFYHTKGIKRGNVWCVLCKATWQWWVDQKGHNQFGDLLPKLFQVSLFFIRWFKDGLDFCSLYIGFIPKLAF